MPRPIRAIERHRTICALSAKLLIALCFLLLLPSCRQNKSNLDDAQISAHLSDEASADQVELALNSLRTRLKDGKPIDMWAPAVVRLSQSPSVAIRHDIADFMAADPKRPEFRAALHRILESDTLIVCNAAALSLAAFGDNYGHELITGMLKPAVVISPRPGHIRTVASTGKPVQHGSVIFLIEAAGADTPVLAPVSGKPRLEVQTGDIVSGGSRLAVIDPDSDQLIAALKALQDVGKTQDLLVVAELEKNPDYASAVREQARLTVQRINERSR